LSTRGPGARWSALAAITSWSIEKNVDVALIGVFVNALSSSPGALWSAHLSVTTLDGSFEEVLVILMLRRALLLLRSGARSIMGIGQRFLRAAERVGMPDAIAIIIDYAAQGGGARAYT